MLAILNYIIAEYVATFGKEHAAYSQRGFLFLFIFLYVFLNVSHVDLCEW